jgi:hypothetical protein
MPTVSDRSDAKERRGHKLAVPSNIASLLNDEQSLALRKVENFGWELAFVRRPLFEDPVPVVVSPDRRQYAVIEADGGLNHAPDIRLRA